jgi:transposase
MGCGTAQKNTTNTKKTVDRQKVDKMDFEKQNNQNFFNLYLPWSRHAIEQRGTDETEKCVITMAILANRLLRARKRNQGKNKNITVLSRHYCVTRLIIRKIKKETEGV